MHRVTDVQPLADFRLALIFDDGAAGTLELKDRLFGPMFEPLREPALFNQVFVDDFGAVAWPNGADLAPDALYLRLQSGSKLVSGI